MMSSWSCPVALASKLIESASERVEWEEFARYRLSQGGDLRKYYPLTKEVEEEYQALRNLQA
jgi:regulator of RNase E activity RraA